VPDNASIDNRRLASNASSTPHVYAPHDPPPWSASPTGTRRLPISVDRFINARTFVAMHKRIETGPSAFQSNVAILPISAVDREKGDIGVAILLDREMR